MYTDIQIHPLASSTREKRFLLSCHGRYYEAALPLVELLEELQQKPDTDAAVAAFVDTSHFLFLFDTQYRNVKVC